MTTLTELEHGWAAFHRSIEEHGGELTPDLADQLECLNLAERSKIDGYALYMKTLQADAQKYRALADELVQKARTAQARYDWLKQRVKDYLAGQNETEVKGEVYRFQLQKNSNPAVEILVPPEDLPKSLVTVTVTPEKALIREGIREGWIEPTVARLAEPTYSVRIY